MAVNRAKGGTVPWQSSTSDYSSGYTDVSFVIINEDIANFCFAHLAACKF